MRSRSHVSSRRCTLSLLALLAVACAEPQAPGGTLPPPPAFEGELLRIAATYREYGRVDDQRPRWAPTNCNLPSPGAGRFSESEDATTHGDKLYYLYARDGDAYRAGSTAMDAVGQVVVKEAWLPVECDAEQDTPFATDPATALPFAQRDGKYYRPGGRLGLFVMFRIEPRAAGTDEGWVYGTVDAPGARVTAVGRLPRCIECHTDAPHGRLFGLPE